MNLRKSVLLMFVPALFVLSGAGEGFCESLKSQHRLVITEIGPVFKAADNEGTDFMVSFKLGGYEYINPSNLGLEIVPLNATVWSGTVQKGPMSLQSGNYTYSVMSDRTGTSFYYLPVWLKYHFRKEGKTAWPYIGLGLGYHIYDEDMIFGEPDQEHSGMTAAGEIGMDLGGDSARHLLSLKIFPGSSSERDGVLVAATYSFRWSFH